MCKLICFDLRKLFRQKSTYICIVIVICSVILNALILQPENSGEFKEYGQYMLLSCISGSGVDIIVAILIAINVCGDFSAGAIKAIVARGYSRTSVYLSKYITTLVITIILIMTCLLSAYFYSLIFLSENINFSVQILKLLICQSFPLIGVASFVFMFSFILKKSAGTIAIGVLGISVISLIISVIDNSILKNKISLSKYWFASFFEIMTELNIPNSSLLRMVSCSVVYSLLFLVFGHFLFARSDV